MEEIQKELDKIYNIFKESIKIIIEGRGRKEYQRSIKLKFDEIDQRQREVNLKIYDSIIEEKYCGMRGV